jgi:O-antigen ligase
MCHARWAIYVLIATTFLFIPLHPKIAVLPADIVAFILVGAYAVDLLLRGAVPLINRLTRPFLIYLSIVFISIALEGFTPISVRFFLRQLLLFATFLAVSHFGHKINIKKILILFVVVANLNSIYSVMQFMASGGALRTFGLAGHGYGDHAMIAFLIATIFFLWTGDTRARIFWGISALIMMGAMAATQTRASVVTAGWALIVIVVTTLKTGKRIGFRVPKKSLITAAILILLVIPILALYTPVFERIIYRFSRIGLQATGTILLRVSLWKAALAAFWANPLFGIGSGNFAQVYLWIPSVRFDPIFHLVTGLSTHSIFMTALAETGIFGFFALIFFLLRAVKLSYRNFKSSVSISDMQVTLCLLALALVIFGSSTYAGAWFWGNNSYHMAVMFGLIASYRNRSDSLRSEGDSG